MVGPQQSGTTPETDLLFVCTGNICRSAYAAFWMRQAVGDRLTVASAGTGAVVGSACHPEIAALFPRQEIVDGHVAQQLTRPLVQGAGLVVGMTREHRSQVVRVFPGALRRTVTLLEVALLAPHLDTSLLPSTPEQRIRAIGPAIMTVRGSVPTDESFDVEDPFGRDADAFRDMAVVMDRALPILRDLILGESA